MLLAGTTNNEVFFVSESDTSPPLSLMKDSASSSRTFVNTTEKAESGFSGMIVRISSNSIIVVSFSLIPFTILEAVTSFTPGILSTNVWKSSVISFTQ